MPSTRQYPKDWKQLTDNLKRACGFKCQMCGRKWIKGGTRKRVLTTHHINGDTTDNSLTNLIVLCAECHLRIESMNRKLIRNLKMKIRLAFQEKSFEFFGKKAGVVLKFIEEIQDKILDQFNYRAK